MKKVKCNKCGTDVTILSDQKIEDIFGVKNNIIQCRKCGADIKIDLESDEAVNLMMNTMGQYAKKHGLNKGGLRPKATNKKD